MQETLTIEKTDQEKAKEISDRISNTITDFHATFRCQQCGKCCQEGLGVALWPHEFKRLKKLMPKGDIYRHITLINNWHALKMPCVFYQPPNKFIPKSKGKCKIYTRRPLACRLYPLGVLPDASIKYSQNCIAILQKEKLNG